MLRSLLCLSSHTCLASPLCHFRLLSLPILAAQQPDIHPSRTTTPSNIPQMIDSLPGPDFPFLFSAVTVLVRSHDDTVHGGGWKRICRSFAHFSFVLACLPAWYARLLFFDGGGVVVVCGGTLIWSLSLLSHLHVPFFWGLYIYIHIF